MDSPVNGAAETAFTAASRLAPKLLAGAQIFVRDGSSRPACGTSGSQAAYNTALHVAALVLILVLSTLACSFPIIVRHFPSLPVPHEVLFLSRHFGTGVLIATAFVHLLPTAFVSLTDPCLPSFWNQGYPAMAGLIAMVSCLTVVSIEMFFAMRGAGHMHGVEYGSTPDANGNIHNTSKNDGHPGPSHQYSQNLQSYPRNANKNRSLADLSESGEALLPISSPSKPPNQGFDEDDLDLDELDPQAPQAPQLFTEPQEPTQQKALLQVLLLEAGILFHSIFIGLALSVSTGPPFIVLLIAISFHQTFEGLALGSRIAGIKSLAPTSPKPWLMALAYGTTTPFGQAIGLGVHGLYDPKSAGGLIVVGIMNAVSSGLLLFAGLVELLAEDFLSEGSYVTLRGKRRLQACGAVAGGAALMAIVGAWA